MILVKIHAIEYNTPNRNNHFSASEFMQIAAVNSLPVVLHFEYNDICLVSTIR